MKLKSIPGILLLCFYVTICTNCNKVFFVDKSKVLREMRGYIFEQRNQLLFIPMDINNDFLSQINGKDAYRIYEYPGYQLAKFSQGDSIQVRFLYYDSVTKQDVGFKENVYLVRVNIVYVDDNKSLSSEKAKIEFEYGGKQYSFTAYANRFTQVYQVVGVTSVLDRK